MNVVNEYDKKRNGFTEVVTICHVMCRYFDRFLLQVHRNWRQACLFYLAPGLICEGYWQVNSRRSIFRFADPKYVKINFRLTRSSAPGNHGVIYAAFGEKLKTVGQL